MRGTLPRGLETSVPSGDVAPARRAEHRCRMRPLATALLAAVCLLATAATALAAPARMPHALPAPVACAGCWVPAPRTSWQWQLSGTVRRSVAAQMYDIDMFEATPALVADLHARG